MVGEPAPTGWLEMYIEIVGGVGRVYEILGFPSIWLVNPPLRQWGSSILVYFDGFIVVDADF